MDQREAEFKVKIDHVNNEAHVSCLNGGIDPNVSSPVSYLEVQATNTIGSKNTLRFSVKAKSQRQLDDMAKSFVRGLVWGEIGSNENIFWEL